MRSDYIQGEWMGVALLFMVVVLLLLYLVTKSPLALGNLFMGGIMMESALRALIIHARASNLYEPGGIIMPWQTVAEYRADPLLESLQGWLIAVHLVGMAAFVWWWMARQRAKGGGRAARQVATPTEEN
ncbi:hypothetical protein IIA16_03580 [bacterium]|nr:hypothetical protein [bacterium]